MQNPQDVQLAAETLADALPENFALRARKTIGIILGTGLSSLAKKLDIGESGTRIPFSALPGFPQSTVQSHEGAFIYGFLGSAPVLAQLGRCHLYEGRSPAEVCMGARVMGTLGIKTLVITNAAGALNPLFEAGQIMVMADMINHTGQSALRGANCGAWGERFPDMSATFDPELRTLAEQKALELGIPLAKGVYIGVHGPEMETPAETRMYRQWGADAVGMSTVLEVAAARHMKMRVLGFSCLTNKNLPDCMAGASLDEVLAMAARCGTHLERLLHAVAAAIG